MPLSKINNSILSLDVKKVLLSLVSGVAGVVEASKALVVGASKNVDTLAVALMSYGSAGMENLLTAGAGGTEANALALSATKSVHRFTIVATAADSAAGGNRFRQRARGDQR